MAITKNALIRYKIIDKCLQNSYKEWTLEDLIEACSNALYEYEGREVNVSKRTVQLDIQLMRSDKLGYNAPIVVYNKKFYKYEDPDYSITDIPLNENDMNVLTETVEMLKQFKDFSLFSELGGIIERLEDKIYTEKTHRPPIIHLDKNENLKGLHYLNELYQAIQKQVVLQLTYKSFKARNSSTFLFHPYLLKEFNNRWFLIGYHNQGKLLQTLALDRILAIDYEFSIAFYQHNFDADIYYKDVVGVTVNEGEEPKLITLWVDSGNAPYVLTKPLHASQKLVTENEDRSIVITINVKINYELVRLLFGFGDALEVISPPEFRNTMIRKFKKAYNQYTKKK